VGIHSNADVGEDDSEAWVKLTPDGRALVCVAISESGQGQRSSLCKMAAEILQLPLDHVNMSYPDTDGNPHEFALVGSRGTFTIGSAVIQAAEDARRQLLEHGARAMKLTPEELDTVDGWVFEIKNPEKAWLPKTNISSRYIFAMNKDYLVYQNNFNHFAAYYRDTFQHGGISMQEMLLPVAVLEPLA